MPAVHEIIYSSVCGEVREFAFDFLEVLGTEF
jgi:hypothetical protein